MLAMLIILITMLLKTSYYAQHYAHRLGPKVTSITTLSCTHDRSPFSDLKNSFKESQSQSLEDYIELPLMLQYNRN